MECSLTAESPRSYSAFLTMAEFSCCYCSIVTQPATLMDNLLRRCTKISVEQLKDSSKTIHCSKKAQTLPPHSAGFRCTREQNIVLLLWSSNMRVGTKGKALLDTWCHLYILAFQSEPLFRYILPAVHCFSIHVFGINDLSQVKTTTLIPGVSQLGRYCRQAQLEFFIFPLIP